MYSEHIDALTEFGSTRLKLKNSDAEDVAVKAVLGGIEWLEARALTVADIRSPRAWLLKRMRWRAQEFYRSKKREGRHIIYDSRRVDGGGKPCARIVAFEWEDRLGWLKQTQGNEIIATLVLIVEDGYSLRQAARRLGIKHTHLRDRLLEVVELLGD